LIGFLRRKNDWEVQNTVDEFSPQEAYEEFRSRIEKSISSLSGHIERLNNKYREMLARSRLYFERCVEAILAKDDEKAKIYAAEIAEIKKLASIVIHSQLMLLQVKIRLETVVELGEALALIRPLSAMLKNIAEEISVISPEASENLRQLMVLIDDFMSHAGVYVEPGEKGVEVTSEAVNILEEAKKIAAEKVRESFPEVPKLTEVEEAVYRYVVERETEEIDLEECAAALNIDVQTVSEAFNNLHRKGLIQLEVAEAN